MSFVATAIIGSAVIGAVGSSIAADKSAAAIGSATDQATAEDRRQYEQTRTDYAPWREAGAAAIGRMEDPNQFFETSPGYEFRRGEGMRDMENRFSVGGGGGNAMRALNDYNQNMAKNEYGSWWNRQAGMAGMGMDATTGTAAAGDRASARIGSNYMTAGRARASGIQQKWGGITNAMQSGISNAMYRWGGPPDWAKEMYGG